MTEDEADQLRLAGLGCSHLGHHPHRLPPDVLGPVLVPQEVEEEGEEGGGEPDLSCRETAQQSQYPRLLSPG